MDSYFGDWNANSVLGWLYLWEVKMISESEAQLTVKWLKCLKLRSDVSLGEDEYSRIDSAIAFLELWLARKMPLRQMHSIEHDGFSHPHETDYDKGWNSAIDACQLASVVSEEEILEIVKGATIKWDCAVPSENWGYEKSVAHAIARRSDE